ncbi:Na+/H+ antiporter [Cellulomonas sp. PS-H5]|uniref:Na+/H+ antiporter n=1 Tax=Cellulomonas sp. PS-H5 TaxID=2820400 RepID=UPI001C4F3A9C|nr:Na+/H+ antiporter [Cellulomonas sp. PS-H5]MBW0254510.1 Na+/H+ antiporter [Cellulomonas sp. PS-H5]
MLTLELIVVVLLALLAGTALGRRFGVAPPLVLLVLGVGLGFLPAFRGLTVPPELVLLVVLPALLYWESLTTSLREIRANLRVIVLSSVLLVVVTAGVVAVVLHALGMPWGPAWILGGVLAPTDATAVAGVARGMPRRTLTTLRAESLVNDGTALVIYAIAVHAVAEPVTGGYLAGRFTLSYLGGAAAGVAVWWLAVQLRERMHEAIQQSVISVLTPFAAFLLAELVEASGVLAVVVAGLLLSQSGPRLIPAAARVQSQSFWAVVSHVLNGALFVLVGMQLVTAADGLTSARLAEALGWTAAAFGAVIGARMLWFHTTPYVVRALDRRPVQRTRRVSWRHRMPGAWAGFRGAVSLAAALGVPETTGDGAPFPGRDVIIFVTGGVILATLLIQGLTLPAVVRWARLPVDDGVDSERHHAEKVATRAALDALPVEAERLGLTGKVVAKLEAEYRMHAEALAEAGDGPADDGRPREADFDALRLAVLAHKRAAVVRLRDERTIDDIVLREVQAQLDAEEVRLTRGALSPE